MQKLLHLVVFTNKNEYQQLQFLVALLLYQGDYIEGWVYILINIII